jgi:hypothetical protein
MSIICCVDEKSFSQRLLLDLTPPFLELKVHYANSPHNFLNPKDVIRRFTEGIPLLYSHTF